MKLLWSKTLRTVHHVNSRCVLKRCSPWCRHSARKEGGGKKKHWSRDHARRDVTIISARARWLMNGLNPKLSGRLPSCPGLFVFILGRACVYARPLEEPGGATRLEKRPRSSRRRAKYEVWPHLKAVQRRCRWGCGEEWKKKDLVKDFSQGTYEDSIIHQFRSPWNQLLGQKSATESISL